MGHGIDVPLMDELTFFCDEARHLVCKPFSIANLHRMAMQLDLAPCWFHAHDKHPHYDIPKHRIAEISAKCTIVDPREILQIIKSCTCAEEHRGDGRHLPDCPKGSNGNS